MSFFTSFPEPLYPAGPLAALAGPFDLAQARSLMWLSQAAYEATADPPTAASRKLERILARWGLETRARLAGGGTQGVVAKNAAAAVVAFAGTDPAEVSHWLTDLDMRTTPDGLHRGFARAAEAIWDAAWETLADTTKPVILTGHSLGGALAIITAEKLARAGMAVGRIGVVTFGAPKVGDATFAASYRASGLWARTVRLEYGSDLITTLPPAGRGGRGFRAVGLTLSCPHGGRFAETMPPRDEAPDRRPIVSLGEARRRLLDHGVPPSPIGGGLGQFVDRMPYFMRDHVQDCYLQALGEMFAPPAEMGG